MRRHGVYVWGDSWEKAKTQNECYDYLFDYAVKVSSLPKCIDPAKIPERSIYKQENRIFGKVEVVEEAEKKEE